MDGSTIATGSGTKKEEKLSAAAERFCRQFSLAEIQSATEDFSEAYLVGHGGFGKVYKGQIDNGEECVAIKRLAPNSNQGEGEFLTEIETLSKLRHINLVSLIGYCDENGEMILVYEYIPRGTLADHRSSLTWKKRLQICIGAGRGLDYLHTGSSIIHRDVKSTNILLDEYFTAKVSDFGLAKHLSTSSSKSHVSTMVKGSFGYLDPSYFTTGRLTRKSDTYAFGVVLLEILCGRPAVDPSLGEDQMSLVMWAREKISKGKTEQIVSPNLKDKISADCLKIFVGIAKRCLNNEPKKRPTMAQVVVQLDFALDQQDKKPVTLNISRFLPFWNKIKPSGSRAINIGVAQSSSPTSTFAIPIHELEDITDNFSSKCLTDRRSYGNVYRGTLKSGQDATIKELSYISLSDNEFLEQVSLASSLKHENMVQLLGYCVDGQRKFLVYEFAQIGSLHDILQDIGVLINLCFLPFWNRIKPSAIQEEALNGEQTINMLVSQIRDVVYEAEDVIDLLSAFQTPAKLRSIAKEVEKIGSKVRGIYDDKGKFDFASLVVGDGEPDEPEAPIVRKEIIVGFEDEHLKLLGYLTEETPHLDVISIIGMPGLGKTTLACKIFRDPAIQYEFPTRIWVYISQEFTKKDVFLNILREFTRLSEDMYKKTDRELAQIIIDHLEKGKFLIVMDDVWTNEDWDKLQIALPKCNKMGKVLITCRNEDVARHANLHRDPHKLRFLTRDESWLLLRYEAFGNPNKCPSDLEVLGKLIAQRCDGLPLALVVIGGILVKKASALSEMAAKKRAWEKVSESVGGKLQDPQERMEKIISLSYYKLPFHLRACFLYFGIFPEDFEIPVWKLIRMWIAEGFIQQKISGISLEETAESYLEDLIRRNLVQVDKTKSDGKVKTCRIHDMLWDFCKLEGGSERENFLQEMKKNSERVFEPPVGYVDTYRRLCIHSNVSNFFGLRPYGPNVRTFVCYYMEDIFIQAENCSAIPAAFKLLRVLDVMPIKLTKIPTDLYLLVHLRYIILSLIHGTLPAAFSKLLNVQTLVIDTTSRTLDIQADIWKWIQLRYLKTNASTTLPKPSKSSKKGEKLQTLGTISPQSCTKEVFDRARNLKKLGIRGRLSLLLEAKTSLFDNLGRLSYLEKLKLLNDVFPLPPSEGQLCGLPPTYKFPPMLRSLTLYDTFLDWSHMSVLGLLQNLEVLKLKDKAFMGSIWEATDGGFPNLDVLEIGRTDLVIWKASGHHFPRLTQLVLQDCEDLQEVPIGLAGIPSFQLLTVHRSNYAAACARKILEERQKKQDEEKTIKFSELKLLIFPPEE